MVENTSKFIKYKVFTYHWYVSGIDSIYNDTVTFSWYESGYPPESFIFDQIISQHDLEESDRNVIRLYPTNEVVEKFLNNEG